MQKYEFTLVLKGSPELTEEIADRLFAAGCDDGTPGRCDGVFSIDFHRTASTLEEAINSAIANVKSGGYAVERVEIDAGALPQPAGVERQIPEFARLPQPPRCRSQLGCAISQLRVGALAIWIGP